MRDLQWIIESNEKESEQAQRCGLQAENERAAAMYQLGTLHDDVLDAAWIMAGTLNDKVQQAAHDTLVRKLAALYEAALKGVK